jgi:uncharacterized protein
VNQPKADPSMEEILASIRRIISEDGSEVPSSKATNGSDEDVLELTEVVGSDAPAMSAPVVEPESNAALASAMAAAARAAEAGEAARAQVATGMPPAPPPEREETMDDSPADKPNRLLSDASADQSARSFGALAAAIDRTRDPDAGLPMGNSDRTLEDIVRELLKPMLREWLDTNLPSLVDRLVQKEIREMVRRAEER